MKTSFFKNILVPTDFSKGADIALEYACEFASKLGAKIVLMHSYHMVPGRRIYTLEQIENLMKQIRQDAENRLKKYVSDVEKKYPSVAIEFVNESGLLFDVIQKTIEEKNIDAIIMGTKGASGFQEYFVGSNTANVIENCNIPVFVIPEEAHYHPIKKILYATDFEYDDITAIKKLVDLASVYDAEIEVVHISPGGKYEVSLNEELMNWFKDIAQTQIKYPKLYFKNVIDNTSILSALNTLIKNKNIDLVAMSTTGKTFIKRLFTGSISRKMAYHTDIPFFCFHIENPDE
ncbi:MAG: universal stress protein [Cytophagaceae bacterium]|nr:universal stress protein [Cytophagaceae bacterium]MDW8457317.1 universal stress protein [Cytophagaceae bacterium]